MKEERGITLIVLVVTITILLILAGVTIRLAILDNNSMVKEVLNSTEIQQQMINEEKGKTSNVIKNYEEEWGLS